MIKRIFLSPANNSLDGTYPNSDDHVHVQVSCDTSYSPVSVTLPDVTVSEDCEYSFYNVPKDGDGYELVITPAQGQKILGIDTTYTIPPKRSASFVSDMKGSWLV